MNRIIFICGCWGLILFSCTGNKDKNAAANSTYITSLQEQVKQNPDSIGLRLMLVNVLDSTAMYKEALAEMDILISKDSLNYDFWFTKGKVQEHAADTIGAIQSLNRAAKVYTSPEALLSLASLYAEIKNKKVFDVCAMVDELKLGREFDSYTSFFSGVYYARTGETEKAINFFDKSINYNYTLMDNYIEKGSLYYEQKKYAEAMKVFNTASTINNTYADAYYWQGKCYEAMNDKPNASSSYSKAFALDKKMKEAEEAMKRLN